MINLYDCDIYYDKYDWYDEYTDDKVSTIDKHKNTCYNIETQGVFL